MTTSEALGAEIRACLARQGQPARGLAEVLGVSPTGVSKRLSGITPITVDELVLIAGSLDVDPEQLLSAARQAGAA